MFLCCVGTLCRVVAMKAVNVRELKNNPSAAMRATKVGPVIILNRDSPEVLMLNAQDPDLERHGTNVAIAIALYRDDAITLAKAARIAKMPLVDFMAHASAQGIPVLKGDAKTLDEELLNYRQWKKQR